MDSLPQEIIDAIIDTPPPAFQPLLLLPCCKTIECDRTKLEWYQAEDFVGRKKHPIMTSARLPSASFRRSSYLDVLGCRMFIND